MKALNQRIQYRLWDYESLVFSVINKENRPSLELIGSKSLLEQFIVFLDSKSKASLRHKSNSRIWKYSISGKYARTALKKLYGNSNIYLKRKYDLAHKAMGVKD